MTQLKIFMLVRDVILIIDDDIARMLLLKATWRLLDGSSRL